MADDYQIKIATTGDPAGAEKVADALQRAGNAARAGGKAGKEQAAGSKEAGKEILSLGETTEKGIGIGRMFAEVLQGNFYALGNVTAALKVTGAAMKTSIIGVALLALTALANFLPTLIGKLQGKKDSLKESFDEAGAAADRLNKSKLESLQTELENIKERASTARSALEAAQAAADKLEDFEMAADLAENKVAPGLTDEQRAANERAIRGKYAESRRERQLEAMAGGEAIAKQERDSAATVALTAAEDLAAMFTKVEGSKARRAAIPEEIRGLSTELENLNKLAGGPAELTLQYGERATEIQNRLQFLRKEQEDMQHPDVLAQEQRARGALETRKGIFATAEGRLRETSSAYDALRSKNYIEKAVMEFRGGADFRRDYSERFGAVADLRSESPPSPYIPETRVRDAASMRAGGSSGQTFDARSVRTAAEQQGGKTGTELSKIMEETIRANNAAIIESFRVSIAQQRQQQEAQIKALRR